MEDPETLRFIKRALESHREMTELLGLLPSATFDEVVARVRLLHQKEWEQRETLKEIGEKIPLEIDGAHRDSDPVKAVEQMAEALEEADRAWDKLATLFRSPPAGTTTLMELVERVVERSEESAPPDLRKAMLQAVG